MAQNADEHAARQEKARKLADVIDAGAGELNSHLIDALARMNDEWWRSVCLHAGVQVKKLPSDTTKAMVAKYLRSRMNARAKAKAPAFEGTPQFAGCDV